MPKPNMKPAIAPPTVWPSLMKPCSSIHCSSTVSCTFLGCCAYPYCGYCGYCGGCGYVCCGYGCGYVPGACALATPASPAIVNTITSLRMCELSHVRNITSDRSTYFVPDLTWQPSCSMRC